MRRTIRALLIQSRYDPLDSLRMALEEHSIDIYTAQTCAEAALALSSEIPPHMAFTEIQLPDGTWEDIVTTASKAVLPVNVIVVAPYVDIGFYVHAIERGAFDFIVPPLSDPEFMHVVRIAADNAMIRRDKFAGTMGGALLARSSAATD